MSQGSLNVPTVGPDTPVSFAGQINTAIDALISKNSGNVAPTNFPTTGGAATAWMDWINTNVAGHGTWGIYDGTSFVTIGDFDTANHVWRPVVGGGFDSLASAATTDLGTIGSFLIKITGTTTITSFGSTAQLGACKVLVFAPGAGLSCTITNNANIVIAGAANIVCQTNTVVVVGQSSAGVWNVLATFRAGSRQRTVQSFLTAGAFTYTPSAGATRAEVTISGASGGGGAQATNAGTAGGTTTFGATGLAAQWTALGGSGGAAAAGTPGAGGTGGVNGTGTLIRRLAGGAGSGGLTNAGGGQTFSFPGGNGGSNPLGGAGTGRTNAAGGAPSANSGGGGAGGGGTGASGFSTGSGGGAGEFVMFEISLIGQGSITGTVGAKGSGGAAGVLAGAAGSDARIDVVEFYD